MHIQSSTTAGSESVGIFFVLCALVFWLGCDPGGWNSLWQRAVLAGLLLTCASAVRYDAWRSGAATPSSRPSWLNEHTRARLAGRLAGLLDGLVGERR